MQLPRRPIRALGLLLGGAFGHTSDVRTLLSARDPVSASVAFSKPHPPHLHRFELRLLSGRLVAAPEIQIVPRRDARGVSAVPDMMEVGVADVLLEAAPALVAERSLRIAEYGVKVAIDGVIATADTRIHLGVDPKRASHHEAWAEQDGHLSTRTTTVHLWYLVPSSSPPTDGAAGDASAAFVNPMPPYKWDLLKDALLTYESAASESVEKVFAGYSLGEAPLAVGNDNERGSELRRQQQLSSQQQHTPASLLTPVPRLPLTNIFANTYRHLPLTSWFQLGPGRRPRQIKGRMHYFEDPAFGPLPRGLNRMANVMNRIPLKLRSHAPGGPEESSDDGPPPSRAPKLGGSSRRSSSTKINPRLGEESVAHPPRIAAVVTVPLVGSPWVADKRRVTETPRILDLADVRKVVAWYRRALDGLPPTGNAESAELTSDAAGRLREHLVDSLQRTVFYPVMGRRTQEMLSEASRTLKRYALRVAGVRKMAYAAAIQRKQTSWSQANRGGAAAVGDDVFRIEEDGAPAAAGSESSGEQANSQGDEKLPRGGGARYFRVTTTMTKMRIYGRWNRRETRVEEDSGAGQDPTPEEDFGGLEPEKFLGEGRAADSVGVPDAEESFLTRAATARVGQTGTSGHRTASPGRNPKHENWRLRVSPEHSDWLEAMHVPEYSVTNVRFYIQGEGSQDADADIKSPVQLQYQHGRWPKLRVAFWNWSTGRLEWEMLQERTLLATNVFPSVVRARQSESESSKFHSSD